MSTLLLYTMSLLLQMYESYIQRNNRMKQNFHTKCIYYKNVTHVKVLKYLKLYTKAGSLSNL